MSMRTRCSRVIPAGWRRGGYSPLLVPFCRGLPPGPFFLPLHPVASITLEDSGNQKKSMFRKNSKSKNKSKTGKDPPEVTQSSASAQPQDKPNKKKGKGKEKNRSSSTRSSKTSIESPASDSNRHSFILQSTAAPVSPSAVGGDKVRHGSPGDGESVFVGHSSEATVGELFHDDPQRVKYAVEDEVKRKPLDKHSPQGQLQEIEHQLQEKEKEFHQESENKSLPERLHALLDCYEKRTESEKTAVSRAHEKVRKGMVDDIKDLKTKMKEAENTYNDELAEIKDKSQALEEKWQEERENMMRAQASLKMEAENADKHHEEEKGKLNSELGKLRSSVEQLKTQMKEKEDELRQVVEKHQQDRQQLQSKLEEMKEEVRGKVTEKEQVVLEKEKENCKLRDEVAELKNKCDDQQAKITDLEEAKHHGHEKLIKSYEGTIKKLQQQLQSQKSEEKATTATASNEEGLRMELRKREEELEELKQQLKRAQENLQEEESKREVDLKGKNDLQQQLQAREQHLEEEARKSKTMEQKLQETEVKLEEQKAKAEVDLKEKEKELEDLQHQLITMQEQVQKQKAGREEQLKELEQLRKTQEQKERELQQQLQAAQEQLQEQERKREESQRKLESMQKAMKAVESSSTTKSAKDLDTYFDSVTKLCEEMTDWKTKAEEQQKESGKLQKLVKRAEELEEANFEAAKKLSETEANIEALRAQIPTTVVAEEGEQTSESGATSQPVDTQSRLSVTELKQKVQELADKLQARDEELHALKSKQGDTPLPTPVSPIESMGADSGEVQSLKRKLKEKEKEVKNLQVQVTSTAPLLEERKELKKNLSSLKSEVAKLTREKKTIVDYSKQQSETIMKLKTESQTLQKALQESSDIHETEDWKSEIETAHQELERMKVKVEHLTTKLDESRHECTRKEAALDVANEQAQKLQQKLKDEVKSLKERAEQMKVHFSGVYDENKDLKQAVADMKKEKESAQKEVERLNEETQQKDSILQQSAEDQKKLKADLSAAKKKCKDLEECNKDVLGSQEQAMKEKDKEVEKLSVEMDKLKEEVKKLKEDVQVKTAQVTQYKKQLQGKHPTADSDKLQLELATSRSNLDETQKELNALSHKHREMEKQYDKKFQEKESQLQQMKAENQRLEKECEMRQKLAEKQKELQQSQAQIQQAEMANELTRLQRARNREDEFSKAFQEEFAAHHVMKARYAELQNQLDSVLDSLDGMRQKQEVLIHTLVEHRVELPFVEPQPTPPAMAQATTETLQWATQPSTHVAISQKPIASPGVYNQGRDQVSYMPPHSNAESQYQEQQAEQRVSNWQHQQQMQQQQQQIYLPTGMERTAPTISPQPQAAFGVPSSQQQAATFERDAVVGLPVSAVSRPIAPRTQQPSHTSQWPLQSRYSDSEIQSGHTVSGQPRGNYPLSPRRVHNPNVAPPNMQSAMGPGGQNQPQNVGHPQLQPGQRGHSQPNVYAGYPQQGESQPPNVDMGRQPLQPNVSAVDMTNRAEHPCLNVPQQPHMGQPHPHNMNYPGPQGNQLQHPQVNLPPQPYEAAVYRGSQMPPRSNAEPQYLEQQQRSSNWQQQPMPGASPYHHQVDVTATNAQAPSCGHLPMITAQSHQAQQLPPPAPQQPPYNTPQLPPEQQVAPLPATHGSQYAQAEFVNPVAETAPPYPAVARPAGSEQKKPSKPEAGTVPPRKESDANEDEQVLMKNLSGAIKETFEEVNQDEQAQSISSGLQSIPPDPNLECVLCGKVFKIGQIQNFKRHSETCTGSQK